ncbi:MAG TPA: LamB/YcsF family protein, partial [Acidimicrobiales bacterium]|nr:LamB/YcsF family protein [Acidimicrobiales bacterium]
MPEPARRIDLNADVGEGSGTDEALLDVVTSASIACGVHAGDPSTMAGALAAAMRRGVAVGAHPSYDDRRGFGRRPVEVTPDELTAGLVSQIGALAAMAQEVGTAVSFVKPHGALYGAMAAHPPTTGA